MEKSVEDFEFACLQYENIVFNVKDIYLEGIQDINSKSYRVSLLQFLVESEISQIITDSAKILGNKCELTEEAKVNKCKANIKEEKNKSKDQQSNLKNAKNSKLNKNKVVEEDEEGEDEDNEDEDEIDEEDDVKDENGNNNNNSDMEKEESNRKKSESFLFYEDVEMMMFNKENFLGKCFVDSLNDIIFYLQAPLQKTALIIDPIGNQAPSSTNLELFLILAYIMKTKNLKLIDAISVLLDSIQNQLGDPAFSEIPQESSYFSSIKKIKEILNSFLQSSEETLEISQLIKYEKECHKEITNMYKCSQCRSMIFTDVDISFYHQYTPKVRYSFKRYGESFIKQNNSCSSFFLRDVDEIFIRNKYKVKKSNKVNYTHDNFYKTKLSVVLNCLKCNAKIGEYYPSGMQCSCGSWVVPACQIIKSKVDEVSVNFDINSVTRITVPTLNK